MTTATFHTSRGAFTVSLMPEHAPKTVENFIGLGDRDEGAGSTRETRRRSPMPCTQGRSSIA